MMNENLVNKIVETIEGTNWDLTVNKDYFTFSIVSEAGQDFQVEIESVDNLEDLIVEISNKYDDFDISAEAYLWLDSDGHGMNGAPYEMADVYEDMAECRESIDELHSAIEDIQLIPIKEELLVLLDETVTTEQFDFIENHEQVLNVTDCGYGKNNQRWFSVLVESGEEFDVYLES